MLLSLPLVVLLLLLLLCREACALCGDLQQQAHPSWAPAVMLTS